MEILAEIFRFLRNAVTPPSKLDFDIGVAEPSTLQRVLHQIYLFIERITM